MIIQPLLFSKEDICKETKMYFRIHERKISLETYFNAFSIGKWKKYTNISNLYFEVESIYNLQFVCVASVGSSTKKYQVGMAHEEKMSRYLHVERKKLPIKVTKDRDRYKVFILELPEDGILYLNIMCEKKVKDIHEVIYSGGYGTDAEMTQSPTIALGICTFKREEFLTRNVGLIEKNLINNSNSPLYNRLDIYISDNGQTLQPNCFNNDKIHFFSNVNAGGAGGFTRCIMEALFLRKNSPFTHIILMDDDIVLDTSVIERTWFFFIACVRQISECSAWWRDV